MATRSELEVVIKGRDDLTPALAKIESRLIRTVGAISAGLAGIKLTTAPIVAAAQFEKELANVRKTTDFAVQDIDKLGDAMLNMSLRVNVTATDLAKIAAAAGQQGLGRYGVAGVTKFTDSVARMASVLDLTAEDAATSIGKIVNIFKIPLDDIEKAVSVFNQVANNSTASGEELLDVVRRIGDAAGALKLEQAVALAATGLDFGQSAEVVGTAYAKVFSSMYENADKFGKLMNMGAKEWIAELQGNGLGAYRKFLEALRKMDAQSQQRAILDLVGGGRIGSLINKQVQDANDSVLLRNFKEANEGSKGLSALREQSIVLNTLAAQTEILQNSFFKLGADASKQLLSPLTQYAAQLSEALQAPGFKSFINAAMQAVGQLITTVADAVKFVASLNVNWENFVSVLKVFLGIKLAEFIGSLISRISLFGASLQSIAAKSATASTALTATGQAASAAATQIGLGNKLMNSVGLGEAIASLKAWIVARKEANAAQAEANAYAKVAQKAGNNVVAANAVQARRDTRAGVAGDAVSQQSARLRAAQNREAALIEKAQQAQRDRQMAAEAAHQARLTAIQANFAAKKAAITASGSRAGLAAIQRERDQELAAQEASHKRSLTGINTYHTRRIQTLTATLSAEVALEREALMKRLVAFDTFTASANAYRTGAGAAAQAQAQATAATSLALSASITRTAAVATAARAAFLNLGLALRTLGTVAATVAGKLLNAFLWVTIIHSILDMTGALEKLGPYIQKVTDFLGLSSEAQRKNKIAAQATTDALAKQTQEIDALTKATSKYLDLKTGQIDTKTLEPLVQSSKNAETSDARNESLAKLTKILADIDALAIKKSDQAKTVYDASIREQLAIIQQGKAEIAALTAKAEQARNLPFSGAAQERLAGQIDAIKKRVEEATKTLGGFQIGLTEAGKDAAATAQQLRQAAPAIGGMFTPESLEAANKYLIPIVQLREDLDKATEAMLRKEQAARAEGADPAKASVKEAEAVANLRNQIDLATTALRSHVTEKLKVTPLDPNVAKSFTDLFAFLGQTPEGLKALIAAANLLNKSDLTGKDAGVGGAPPTPGTNTYTKGNGESAARKLARARLARERAEIQAANALADEKNKQAQAAEDALYQRGLTALADYYGARRALQEEANARDIADKQLELKAINDEIKNATDAAEKEKFRTEAIKVNGQIAVLKEQRNQIAKDAVDGLRSDQTAFRDRMRTETIQAISDGIEPLEGVDLFQNVFDASTASMREFFNLLDAEATDASAKLKRTLEAGMRMDAFAKSIAPLQSMMDTVFGNISRMQARLDNARKNSALTSQEAEARYSDEIRRQMPVLQAQLRLMEEQLEKVARLNGTSSAAYQRQVAAIDDVRLALENLSQQTDATARSVNDSIKNNVADAIYDLTQYGSSAKDVLNAFLLSVSQTIIKMFAQDLSEKLFKSLLGDNPAGGIGGFIQRALQSLNGKAASGAGGAAGALSKTASTVADAAKPDGSIAKPLYTLDAKEALGVNGAEDGLNGLLGQDEEGATDKWEDISKLFESDDGEDKTVDAVTGLGSTLGNVFTQVGEGIGGGLNSIVGIIQSVFSTLMAFLSADAAADAASGAVSTAASIAHSGGRVGASPLRKRKVNPAIFNNANRFHTGLRPDEIPAILQTGERVLNRNQNAEYERGLMGGTGEVSIRNVLMVDENFVPDSMSSSQGEKVIMTHLTKNKAAIKQMLNS